MKKTNLIMVICSIALLLGGNAYGQKCGSGRIKDILIAKNPAGAPWFDSIPIRVSNTLAALSNNNTAQKTTAANPIPVIFHVVLDTASLAQAGGIAGIASRAITQIDVLNECFAGLNADSANIPAAFLPRFGKSSIRFALAHRKPNGTGTPGYEITVTNKPSFSYLGSTAGSTYIYSDAKYASSGGADGWDSSKYLNVWIIKPSSGNELGGTFSPSYITGIYHIPGREIGLAISYDAFGVKSADATVFKTYNKKGKTIVHEMGHFFELIHPWGDDNGLCPGQAGGIDDGFTDTPPEADGVYGDPAYPKFDVCSPASTISGLMFNNYMDYVNDTSMLLFTQQQVAYMDSKVAPGGQSYSLTQHPEVLFWPTEVKEVTAAYDVVVYPNPSAGVFSLSIPGGSEKLKTVSVINIVGQVVKDIPLQSINLLITADISTLSNGIYSIRCQFEDQTIIRKIILQK